MLKIGNRTYKVFLLASWLLSFYVLVSLPPAAARTGEPAPAASIHPQGGPRPGGPGGGSDRFLAGQLSRSLDEKLHLWLIKQLEPPALEEFVLNSQAILDSAGFDLYLLELWLKGHPLEALALLDSKLDIAPDDQLRLNQVGSFFFSLGEYELARDFFTAASTRWPDQPSILNNLAATLSALGLRKEAADLYRQCLELDPCHPEANLGLYELSSLEAGGRPDQSRLIKALQGAYREKVARLIGIFSWPLPQSFEQEVNFHLPPLPSNFEQYISSVSIYQEALFELSQREGTLARELARQQRLAATSSSQEKTDNLASSWRLFSSMSYACLLQAEGRLDWLEREAENPADLDLERIITASVQSLESVYKAYLQQEKKALDAPHSTRADELKKARDYYCLEYRKEVTHWYLQYRERLLAYFQQARQELKTFLPRFYFWLRYLPENQQTSRRQETELRLIKIYSRLWEKALWLQTRLGQPAFADCLPALEPSPEDRNEPDIPLYSPVDDLELAFKSEVFSFSLKADQVGFSDTQPAAGSPGKALFPSATIYLYPPASENNQPVYLVVDEEGRLIDLGKLVSLPTGRLSPGSHFEIVFNLSYPSQRISSGAKDSGADLGGF